MKQILLLQLRREQAASDNEYEAFVKFGGLKPEEIRRVRMDQGELPKINLDDYSAVVLPGGPWNVSDEESDKDDTQLKAEKYLFKLLDEIAARDFPYYGACYGLGALVRHQGGVVSKENYAESVEAVTISLKPGAHNDPLLQGLPREFQAFGGHKESVQELPASAIWLASSATCPHHMIRLGQNVYASQFHPELDVEGLCLRIDIYKNAGYFPPEDAAKLKASARQEQVEAPTHIWRNFVAKYHKHR